MPSRIIATKRPRKPTSCCRSIPRLEDWGTHVSAYQPDGVQIHMQQPLMERLYPQGTRSLGDVLLTLLKQQRPQEYDQFPDYYAYLEERGDQEQVRLQGCGRGRRGVLVSDA